MGAIKKELKRGKFDLGAVFDGDGDRVNFLDSGGNRIASDFVALLIAKNIIRHRKNSKFVLDLRFSKSVFEAIKYLGGKTFKNRVGHAFFKKKMRGINGDFGGEISGHFYFKDFFYADSALLIFLRVLEILSCSEKGIGDLIKPYQKYFSTGEINFKVKDKEKKIKEIEKKYKDGRLSHLDGLSVEFKDWWFNTRHSNTESLLRLNLEARTKELLKEKKKELRKLIETN